MVQSMGDVTSLIGQRELQGCTATLGHLFCMAPHGSSCRISPSVVDVTLGDGHEHRSKRWSESLSGERRSSPQTRVRGFRTIH